MKEYNQNKFFSNILDDISSGKFDGFLVGTILPVHSISQSEDQVRKLFPDNRVRVDRITDRNNHTAIVEFREEDGPRIGSGTILRSQRGYKVYVLTAAHW